jgi:hypothetical protein
VNLSTALYNNVLTELETLAILNSGYNFPLLPLNELQAINGSLTIKIFEEGVGD